jgi:mono/diheme cytochrome c family protein
MSTTPIPMVACKSRRPILWRACIALLSFGVASYSQGADYVAMSGEDLYLKFCASCHGAKGRGDGPVSSQLKVEVPDLTLIARRQGGRFDRDKLEKIIDGRFLVAAHGTRTMPVWGEDFSRAQIGDPDAERGTRIITGRLADYVWLLQRPIEADAKQADDPKE